MKYIALILLFLTAQTVSAQDWAKTKLEKSPRHREWVTVKHDGRSVETFVVYPESKGKTPVVLIIHEIFGMTDWVQDLADQVAEAGGTLPWRPTCFPAWARTAAAVPIFRRVKPPKQ